MKRLALAAVLILAAAGPAGASIVSPHEVMMGALRSLCGKAYEGRMVTADPADKAFAGQRLVMGPVECTAKEVRIPLAVGADRSRTWVLSPTKRYGLRLKHIHRHDDGQEDVLSRYGGEGPGDFTLQPYRVWAHFPADAFSRTLFTEKGNPASVENVWGVELTRETFAYELRRPNRHFRVEFDLTRPLP